MLFFISVCQTSLSVYQIVLRKFTIKITNKMFLFRSKLGALFGMDKSGNPGENASLTYTAPKQPKKKGNPNTTLPAIVVMFYNLRGNRSFLL